jgi:hypothetical protein
MRRVLILSMLFILLLTACASEAAPTEEHSDVSEPPTSAPVPTDPSPDATPIGPVEETVIKQLAMNLGLKENDITVISSEETEFSDACLGVTMEGVMCAQVITPGRIIVLEADGVQYEYHTSEDGSRVQPATLALIWKREGGIAGFCDSLTVYRSGEVYANSCNSQAQGSMDILAEMSSASEKKQFSEWIAMLGEIHLDVSDPKGVADRMVVTLDFFGTGSKTLAQSQQQALVDFAQNLYQKLAQ